MSARGVFVLVVGPSGAGKDTLIAGARARLADDPRYVFVRRLVTRVADPALEDHDTITRAALEQGRARGEFALSWDAHGLGYALPGSVRDELAAGRVVVANASRRAIGEAGARYPVCAVLEVTARAEVRAARLGARGRETAADISARLAHEGAALPAGIPLVRIDNSTTLEAGLDAFLVALRGFAG